MRHEAAIYLDQFGFQAQHACGRVLNVGCNSDGANIGLRPGAVNLDVLPVDPVTREKLPVHVLADGRHLPFAAAFDSVVVGELLEHMERADAVRTLCEARRVLKPGGRVVITMPHDGRRESPGNAEPPIKAGQEFYAPGVRAYHYRLIGRPELLSWIAESGLEPQLVARIHYVWGEKGTGVVAS